MVFSTVVCAETDFSTVETAALDPAFGHPAEGVLYLAISADSEDTGSRSVARLRGLHLVEVSE